MIHGGHPHRGPLTERGRELKATELKPATIVVIHPPDTPADFHVTMWVSHIAVVTRTVRFYSAVMKWVVEIHYNPEGELYDDQLRRVHVYEYLGEI